MLGITTTCNILLQHFLSSQAVRFASWYKLLLQCHFNQAVRFAGWYNLLQQCLFNQAVRFAGW